MQRRPWLQATTLLLAAGLSLTACGSSSDSDNGDKIKGTQKDGKSASPSGTKRPKIKTPGFTMQFDGWTNSDPTKQAILNDGKERERSQVAAIIKGKGREDLSFYSKASGLRSAKQFIKGFQNKGLTLTGSTRYYNPQIKLLRKKSAVLDYCGDENKGYTKVRKTGKVNREPTSKDGYVRHSTKLERNEDGVWQTAGATLISGGCKP